MFWIDNFNELLKPVLVPTDYMTIEEKLNTLTRLIVFICFILAIVLQESKIILLMIILVIIIIIVYQFQKRTQDNLDTFLDDNNIKVVENSVCTKPTKNNPFMNPSFVNMNNADDEACPINDKNIARSIDDIFNSTIFRDSDDIYDRNTSKRQFYTVPASSIPNDQTKFANWLYNRGKSCKENNGQQCYNNIYTDLRQ